MRSILIFIAFLCITGTAFSQGKSYLYNENQNLQADLGKAILRAQKENKNILVQFGGNWCPWCLRFHALVKGYMKLSSLLEENYVYLLLNVPREKDKRDYELFRHFEHPDRFGFPVFLILDKNGKRLNTQDSEAFEYPNPKVPGYDTAKVERFLKMWTMKALDISSYMKK